MDTQKVDIEKVYEKLEMRASSQSAQKNIYKNNCSILNIPSFDEHGCNLTITKVSNDSKVFYKNSEVEKKKAKLEIGLEKINKAIIKLESHTDSNINQTENEQKTISLNSLTSFKKSNKFNLLLNENYFLKEDKNNRTSSVSCQTPKYPIFCIADLRHNEKAIEFYTGLQNYDKLSYVFKSLGPDAHDLQYYYYEQPDLTILDQFFMTLMILRQHKSHFEISILFGITLKDIKNIFITWIRFMKLEWTNLKLPASYMSNTQLKNINIHHTIMGKETSTLETCKVDNKIINIVNHRNKNFKKVYKILNGPQNYIETHLMNDIIFICHVLCYFKARRIPVKEHV